jgi:DNA-binding MarR family transcriptional regulator
MTEAQVEQLNYEIHNFFNLFNSWEISIVRSSRLSIAENHATEILGIHGEMTMKELAERLSVTQGTVTATIDKLERGGYARRKKINEDRRAYIIELTPDGERAFKKHHDNHLRLTKEMMSLLGEEDTDALIRIFRKLNEQKLTDNPTEKAITKLLPKRAVD